MWIYDWIIDCLISVRDEAFFGVNLSLLFYEQNAKITPYFPRNFAYVRHCWRGGHH